MSNRFFIIGLAAVAAFLTATVATSFTSARAGALEELEAINESSQEAVEAPTDEEAKDLSGQGFDTPSSGGDDSEE